jgi:thiol peroxidase
MSDVQFKGNPNHTSGELPAVGSIAPDLANLIDGKLGDASLSNYAGKKKLLNIVPSLDTGICAASARKFNEKASQHPNTVMLIISCDLPFAQGRFCAAEGLENVISLSMMRSKQFAEDYGVLLVDGPLAGLASRAVVILDENNKVIYTELVNEITQEPDYDSALAAL